MEPSADTPDPCAVGRRAPDFELDDLDGRPWSLAGGLGERGAVVLFWSSVCSHCRRYDGWLRAFPARRPELALVLVACRRGEAPHQLAAAVAERRLGVPLVLDPERQVAGRWGVQQTPRAFLLDPKRRVLYRGAIDNFTYPEDPRHEPYLERAIEALLSGRPVERPETASFGCPIDSRYYDLPPLRPGGGE